ncbi:MAG: topA [Patescibacteria group bacterium]|nr:topA [Patescibacteria group bacterium]
MKLLIVESPSKAKTIEKYLDGKYTVRASIGHIRDLPKSNKDAIDIPAGFIPHYEISPGKGRVISELQALANKADEVILATDPDREGEAISWHLKEVLKGIKAPIKRATFHEITKEAVTEALKHPRDIDEKLVEAQEARRVLDRLVGYDLSGLIWKKVRYGLSAGRVQSPALRILMEKEREIRAFKPEDYWVIEGLFAASKEEIKLTCVEEPRDKKVVDRILEIGNKEQWFVTDVKESEQKRSPRAPFTTSTIQQTASTRLGFSPSRTMQVAQRLYEAGHITYMRTDSTSLSKQAQAQILSLVEKKYGKENAEARTYATKSKNAQEAHEAIRPTHFEHAREGATDEQVSLYKLIWQRAVSSQMADAKLLKTKIVANVKDSKEIPDFTANGSRLLSPGWLAVDTGARGEDVELPKLAVGEELKVKTLEAIAKQTQPPSRYTEAGLVKELEARGIGRPSTYASIMRTIEDRGYVKKEGRTLFPTDTGDVVSTFLENNFENYISDTFTADMEDKLDQVADGNLTYLKLLKDFYGPFEKDVESKENIPKLTTLGDAPAGIVCPTCGSPMVVKLGKNGKFLSCARFPDCTGALMMDGTEIGHEKPIGVDIKTGLNVYLLTGRFGPYVQLGETPEKLPKVKKKRVSKKKVAKKTESEEVPAETVTEIKEAKPPRRASLPVGVKPENVTLELALKLLELPRELGIDPKTGEPVIANIGRFGPYVGVGREFRSIKKSSKLDPYTITFDQAIHILNEPKLLPKGVELVRTVGKHPKTNKEIQILKSKSGMFMRQGLQRIYLPDNTDPNTITMEEVIAMMAMANADKKRKK